MLHNNTSHHDKEVSFGLVGKDSYPGNFVDETPPSTGTYKKFEFDTPFRLICFFDENINNGKVTLYKWQHKILTELGTANPTMKHPFKYLVLASNGSGKDKFIIAPFATWFALTKIRSRCIITTSSGTQLTSQTEPYIVDLCNKINAKFGYEVFRIRQRYIKCIETGSEIRLFVTDEKGKAEGYHPIDTDSEMAIIVNEWKSVTSEITESLRRCTGYNFWLGCSSSGEPKGALYEAFKRWPSERIQRITSYDCPHQADEDIQADKEEYGESSAFFRSKHLSLFTTIGGTTVIKPDTIDNLFNYPPQYTITIPVRVGIDLAAGGDENVICILENNKVRKEYYFREKDTYETANRISEILTNENIPRNHEHIYADDGGVGRAIIDSLCHKNWNISRVMNQWAALGNKKQYGNRGAENWYRANRILEEKVFDITNLSNKTREQLKNRHYKQSLTGGRIFLRDKREEKGEGFESPDRADAFILALTGLTVLDFLKSEKIEKRSEEPAQKFAKYWEAKPEDVARASALFRENYEVDVTFARWNHQSKHLRRGLINCRKAINE